MNSNDTATTTTPPPRLKRALERSGIPTKLTAKGVFTYLLDTNQRIDALDTKIRRFSRLSNNHLQEVLLLHHKMSCLFKTTSEQVDKLALFLSSGEPVDFNPSKD